MDAARAHQYLKAMGITSWVARDSAAPAVSESASESRDLPLANAHAVSDYLEQLADVRVAKLQQGAGSVLLLVEPPLLTEADKSLLAKMLAAIGLELESQSIASLTVAGEITVPELISVQQPDIVLLMVGSGDAPAAIEPYRVSHQVPPWSKAAIATTYHPADLIRYPALKRPAWEDLKRVKVVLDG